MRHATALRALAGLAALIAVAVVVETPLRVDRLELSDGCGGNDGHQYCLMARGITAEHPYSRRLLLPALARALSWTGMRIPDAFLVLNLVAFVVILVIAARLALYVADRAGVGQERWSFAVIAASLLVIAPLGFRWIWYYPALVDPAAAALGLAWLIVATSGDRRCHITAVVLAFLTVLCRDAWAPLIIITAIVILIVRIPRRRADLAVAGATVVAVGVALWLGARSPGLPNSVTDDTVGYARSQIAHFTQTRQGLEELLFDLIFGLGLIPLVLLTGGALRRRVGHDVRLTAAVSVAVATIVIAPPEGLDVSRYVLFGAAPIVFAFVARAGGSRRAAATLFILLAASAGFWRPDRAIRGTLSDYFSYFSPVYLGPTEAADHLVSGLIAAGIAAAAAGAVIAIVIGAARVRSHPA